MSEWWRHTVTIFDPKYLKKQVRYGFDFDVYGYYGIIYAKSNGHMTDDVMQP